MRSASPSSRMIHSAFNQPSSSTGWTDHKLTFHLPTSSFPSLSHTRMPQSISTRQNLSLNSSSSPFTNWMARLHLNKLSSPNPLVSDSSKKREGKLNFTPNSSHSLRSGLDISPSTSTNMASIKATNQSRKSEREDSPLFTKLLDFLIKSTSLSKLFPSKILLIPQIPIIN